MGLVNFHHNRPRYWVLLKIGQTLKNRILTPALAEYQ
jgi:hypothetical protein